MNKIIFVLIFVVSFIQSNAQKLTTPSNYLVVYKLKIAEIADARTAKDASVDLTDLFDSNLQTFNPSTNELVIKSVFVQDQAKFAANLLELGYTLVAFSVTYKETSTTTTR